MEGLVNLPVLLQERACESIGCTVDINSVAYRTGAALIIAFGLLLVATIIQIVWLVLSALIHLIRPAARRMSPDFPARVIPTAIMALDMLWFVLTINTTTGYGRILPDPTLTAHSVVLLAAVLLFLLASPPTAAVPAAVQSVLLLAGLGLLQQVWYRPVLDVGAQLLAMVVTGSLLVVGTLRSAQWK